VTVVRVPNPEGKLLRDDRERDDRHRVGERRPSRAERRLRYKPKTPAKTGERRNGAVRAGGGSAQADTTPQALSGTEAVAGRGAHGRRNRRVD